MGGARGLITAADCWNWLSDAECFPAAQKIVAQKKQAALQACKSLPNSPSHSGGSTPGSAQFPGQVAPPTAAHATTATLPPSTSNLCITTSLTSVPPHHFLLITSLPVSRMFLTMTMTDD